MCLAAGHLPASTAAHGQSKRLLWLDVWLTMSSALAAILCQSWALLLGRLYTQAVAQTPGGYEAVNLQLHVHPIHHCYGQQAVQVWLLAACGLYVWVVQPLLCAV